MDEIFKVEFVVESASMTLKQISAHMGRQPDEGWNFGSFNQWGHRRDFTSWSVRLSLPPCEHAGTVGLPRALLALGTSFADAAANLVEQGCSTGVVVVQYLSDDSASTGIDLPAEAVSWIARARASFGIDQYVITPDDM